MAWFYDTFLPAIFDRAGTNNGIWLTKKQTNICAKYMEKHVFHTPEFQGDYTRHVYYSTKWDGRDVRLDYSKLNDCGIIEFSFNSKELAEHQRIIEQEKEQKELERIAKLKIRHPEKFEDRREKARKKYEDALEDLRLDIEEGEDEETIQLSREWVEVCKKEFERYV